MNNRMSMYKGHRADDVLSHSSSHSSDTSDIIYSQISPIHSGKRAVTAKSITSSSVPLNVSLTNNKIDVFASRTHNRNIDRSDRLEHNNDNIIDNALNVKNVNTKVNVAKIMEMPEHQPKQQQQQQQQTQLNSVISVSLKSINAAMTMNTESFFSSSTSSAASSSSSSVHESSSPSKASSSLSSSTTSSDKWGGFEQSFKVALHNNEVDMSTLSSNIKINSKEKITSKRTISDNNNNNDDNDKGWKNKIINSEPHTNRKDVFMIEELEKAHQVRSKDNNKKSNIEHINEEKDRGSVNAEIEEESDGLFIPDTVFQLSCAMEKPQIPYLSESQLTIGSTVWVVDEEDVETIMKIYWQPIHKRVCNGKMKGIVQRHSGNMTLVKFSGTNEADTFVLTLPRICLSLKEIAPYESICQSEMRGIMTACYSNLSPRATRGRATCSNDVSIVDNVYRDAKNNNLTSKEDSCGAHDNNNYTCNLRSTLERDSMEESCKSNTGRSERTWNEMNTKTMNDKNKVFNYHNVMTDKSNWTRRNKLNEPLQRIDRIACCYYETALEHDTSLDIHNTGELGASMTENIWSSWEEVYKVGEQKFFKGLFLEALEAFKPIEHELTSIDEFISSRIEEQSQEEEEQKQECHEEAEVKKYHCEEREKEESDNKLYLHEECSSPLQQEAKSKRAKYFHLMKTLPSELILKILLLRSRIFLFLEKYDSALIDAQRCVRLSQRNPLVYLHLARAHSAVADFESAKLSIATAKLLASSKLMNVLDEVDELNSYMLAIQSFMKEQGSDLTVYLDPYYRKRLCPVHSFNAKETMFCHDRPIISLSSFFSEPPANTCNFCYAPVELDSGTNTMLDNTYHPDQIENVADKKLVNEQEEQKEKFYTEETRENENIAQFAHNIIATKTNETSNTADYTSRSDDDNNDYTCNNNNNNVDTKEVIQKSSTCDVKKKANGYLFCSSECTSRGTRLFELMQVHKDGITRARELIYSKAAVTIDRYPLEMGAMTIRLFFYVIAENTYVMKEQCVSSEEQETTLKEALKHLNVYPMVTEIISSRLRDEIGAVYDALTVNFTPKHKALYSIELFTYLYRYVRAYFVSVQIEEFNVNNKDNTNNFNTNKNDKNDKNICNRENQNTSNIVISNTTNFADNDGNINNVDEERESISEEKPAEMLDITRAASTSSTDKRNRLDLVFPLFANDNTNRHKKLTLFCLPTIIGGVDKASVTSCFGSGHVEIRHLAAIASLSKSQLGASKSLNIATDDSRGNSKRDSNMGRSYNISSNNKYINNNSNNDSSKSNRSSSSSADNVDETICFASAPPNCEIHAKFTTVANINELPSVMHSALTSKHPSRYVTPEEFAQHTTSASSIAEERLEEKKKNVTTEESNIENINNDRPSNVISIVSQNEIEERKSNHNHTEDVKVRSSEDEQLGVVDDSKFTFVENHNKLHMQLIATRSINKNDKLLLPPFVLDFS